MRGERTRRLLHKSYIGRIKEQKLVWLYWAWFDAWVGLYYDREKHRLYVQPLPCIGLRIEW